MTLPLPYQPGHRYEIGAYLFTEERIVKFARKYDPQRFHVDPEAAKLSVLGGLCASGWHTAAAWMSCQRAYAKETQRLLDDQGQGYIEFGPSPGFEKLKWLRPVYVDDRITYTNDTLAVRPSNSRTGWHVLTLKASGQNQNGAPVIEFASSVLIRHHPAKTV